MIDTPYAFAGPYAGCYFMPEVSMDARHVFMLHDILCLGHFSEALELGSFSGASSTAFIEAINIEHLDRVTFCDVSIQESLVDVVLNCRFKDRTRVTPQPSWVVLNSKEPFDFVLVDAAHDAESVGLELKHLLRRRPRCVMAHDTNATAEGYSACEGAQMLKRSFESHPDYLCIEDSQRRPGERTERGLFFATTDEELYRIAREVFNKWSH